MKKLSVLAIFFLILTMVSAVSLFASGSGHHSHGHDESAVSSSEKVAPKDTQGGVDAYLEFYKSEKLTATSSGEFFSKCLMKASLQDSKSGESLMPSKLVL